MFDFWKKRPDRRGLMVYIVFGAIIIVFVFLGYNTFDTPGLGYAARVNNNVITVNEYQDTLNRYIQFYSNMFGGNFDAKTQRQMRVRENALQQLINNEIAAQGAVENGIVVSEDELRDFLMNYPVFQENGRFRREYYDNYLQYRRIGAAQFEGILRRELLVDKSKDLFTSVFTPTKKEIEKEKLLKTEKVNLDFVEVSKSQLKENIKISRSRLNEFKNSDEGKTKINDYYEKNKAKFKNELEVKASHILVKTDPKDPAASKTKIDEIAKEVNKDNFSKLAKEHSDDPGSKSKGGDLGFFGKGRMVPEFEKTAFSLKVGEISKPVKSSFGYHIIYVVDRKEEKQRSLEEVSDEIAETLIKESEIEGVRKDIESIAKSDDPRALTSKLKDLGLEWQETGFFNLSQTFIPKIGNSEEILSDSFSLENPKDKVLQKIYEVSGKSFIVKVKERKTESNETEIDSIKDSLAQTQNTEMHRNWIEAIGKEFKIERNPSILSGTGRPSNVSM